MSANRPIDRFGLSGTLLAVFKTMCVNNHGLAASSWPASCSVRPTKMDINTKSLVD